MKKILICLTFALALVSCGKSQREYYFDNGGNRSYNNPEEALDTMSFAVGANVGMSLRFQPSGIIFDVEKLISAIETELSKEVADQDFIDKNGDLMKRFSTERLRPYPLAKMRADQNAAEFTAELPSLYDDGDFTEDKVASYFGVDVANYIRNSAFLVNRHWVYEAMRKAFLLKDRTIVDESNLGFNVAELSKMLGIYNKIERPIIKEQMAREWLANVAKQRGVEMMLVEGDTLYYRVDVAGNEVRPQSLRDTIGFSYVVYNQHGGLVESLEERIGYFREALAHAETDTTMTVEEREQRIELIKSQLEANENLRIPVTSALVKGAMYGVRNVGEGGELTLWMPSSLAFGTRGNRFIAGNEGVVMSIKLKSVEYGKSDEEVAAEEEAARKAKMIPGFKKTMKDIANRKGMDAQVVPTTVKPSENGEPAVKPVRITPVEK